MKITFNSEVKASNKEVATITIEFDPNLPQEEGMATMIMAVCDTARQVTVLQYAINTQEKQ